MGKIQSKAINKVEHNQNAMSEQTLHPLQNLNGCFNTRSRVKFNLFAPTPDMIIDRDISHALAFNPHFNGHSPKFFSIAQHCLLVVELIEKKHPDNIELLFMGLMHDAAEAYVGDMMKPLKIHFPLFSQIENNIMQAIAEKHRLRLDYMPFVKPFDIEAQVLEYEQFYKGEDHFSYLTPDEAEVKFMEKFFELYGKRER